MNHGRNLFATVVFIIFASLGHPTGYAETTAETRVVSALLAQFETVGYTTSGILPGSSNTLAPHVDSEDYLKVPFLEFIDGLNAMGPTKSDDFKKSYGALIVGAKNFAPPNGIGTVHSDKCYIGVPSGGAQSDMEASFSQAQRETIGGRQAWLWTIPASEENPEQRTFYAAQLPGWYLLMCNNRPDFEKVAKSLSAKDAPITSQINALGWKTFSAYNYWVYRSVRRIGGDNPSVSGLAQLTPDVTSLAFFADIDRRQGFIRVFGSETQTKTAPKILPESRRQLFISDTSGVWRAEIPLARDEESFDSVFYVFNTFGFGAVL
jgi:hypothetical protein